VAGVGPVGLADRGLARAFQLIQIFPKLTVKETIAAAVISRRGERWRLFSRLTANDAVDARVIEVAEIFGLTTRLERIGGTPAQDGEKVLRVAPAFPPHPPLILL